MGFSLLGLYSVCGRWQAGCGWLSECQRTVTISQKWFWVWRDAVMKPLRRYMDKIVGFDLGTEYLHDIQWCWQAASGPAWNTRMPSVGALGSFCVFQLMSQQHNSVTSDFVDLSSAPALRIAGGLLQYCFHDPIGKCLVLSCTIVSHCRISAVSPKTLNW